MFVMCNLLLHHQCWFIKFILVVAVAPNMIYYIEITHLNEKKIAPLLLWMPKVNVITVAPFAMFVSLYLHLFKSINSKFSYRDSPGVIQLIFDVNRCMLNIRTNAWFECVKNNYPCSLLYLPDHLTKSSTPVWTQQALINKWLLRPFQNKFVLQGQPAITH